MPSRVATARKLARRITPLMVEAFRRWQAMPPEQRERYITQVRGYADKGRKALGDARRGSAGSGPRGRRRR